MEVSPPSEFFRRHARLIHKVASAYCRNAADHEDVVQEIAVQLWRSRERYDPRFQETTWIYRIALNVAISFQRRERRHREGRASDEGHLLTLPAVPAAEPDERVELLLECIHDLAALDRALVLLYLDGIGHAAIGDVLGISASNVGTKLGRIKDKLRVALEARTRSRIEAKEAPHAAG